MLNVQKVVLKGKFVYRLSHQKVANRLFELGSMTTFGEPYQKDFIHQTNHPQSSDIELSFLMMSRDFYI